MEFREFAYAQYFSKTSAWRLPIASALQSQNWPEIGTEKLASTSQHKGRKVVLVFDLW